MIEIHLFSKEKEEFSSRASLKVGSVFCSLSCRSCITVIAPLDARVCLYLSLSLDDELGEPANEEEEEEQERGQRVYSKLQRFKKGKKEREESP